ncbi:YgaP family membrane protein [Aquibacillus saliphilus]|uniref:YgaP family membrane protein n=1 Tax=Aquibacillus saliphilus TaxID=1909422 RepID=UPI001CEFF066|nr:DUF2892 domain-containing protein [Aquibacillus saliphilus]
MIRQNIGILNALLRITIGLTFLTYTSVNMNRRPWRQGSILLIILSAMKVAEGIVRYCPVTDIITNYIDSNEMESGSQSEEEGLEEAINPS